MHLFRKILKWAGIVILGIGCAYIILVIFRTFHFYNLDKTNEQVAIIHATKLTIDDVMGENLPPDPGEEADKTIQGIDANQNGVRDDVELAIFKEYPSSAKTRAALLQYALALQMEMIQPIINKTTVTAVAEETSRADDCVSELVPRKNPESPRSDSDIEKIERYNNFIEAVHLNNEARKKAQYDFYEGNLGSYELPSGCDIDLKLLPD